MVVCEPWPIDETCIPDDWPDDPATVDRLLHLATEILHAASGRTVGVCQYTVRPCRSVEEDLCQGVCGCAPACSVRVGHGQVQRIESIRLSGETLPEGAWRLYTDGTVVFADGWCPPPCQDLSLPASEPGTWEVTYWEGVPPTGLAARAVTAVMAQLARECAQACGVPSRRLEATNVEGESRTFAEDAGVFAGLPEVDDWLAAVNPFGARRQAAVFTGGRHWREMM